MQHLNIYITVHLNVRDMQVNGTGPIKSEGLKRGLQSMETSDYLMSETSMFLYVVVSYQCDIPSRL